MRKVGVFGWGVVAPMAKNIDIFTKNLESNKVCLEPFDEFGPSNFLVGKPDFDFSDYKNWIDSRFPPNRFYQLQNKMDSSTLFAIGAFIQSLQQNKGIEKVLQSLGMETHVYMGTGIGSITTVKNASVELYKAQRKWNRFWADKENNSTYQKYLAGDTIDISLHDIPKNPNISNLKDKDSIEDDWWKFWMQHSPQLKVYLKSLEEIDSMTLKGKVESGKLKLIKDKHRLKEKLQQKWGAPTPPWESVSADIIWNIHNTPASQITMLGKIHGKSFAPTAACSSFNICLKLALSAIRNCEAKAVIVGASESYPSPEIIGAFARARVAASASKPSFPLTELTGTHIAGGATVWIVGDYNYMVSKGFKPLGMEPISVGTSSDADHIITPSEDGPKMAIKHALKLAEINPEQISAWDLHATATPGDLREVRNLLDIVPKNVIVTARKASFGHGLGVCGGWELTAQYLCYQNGFFTPTPIKKAYLNEEIKSVHKNFVFDMPCPLPEKGYAGKLSMGVGGINACVISHPWKES